MEALGIEAFCIEMKTHEEEYEHLGKMSLYVQDLEPVWQRERERRQVMVTEDDAMFTNEVDIPAEPPLVWDYFTKPEYRKVLFDVEEMEIKEISGGRVDADAVYVCAHGDFEVPQPVLDWKPFDYYTIETPIPGGASVMITTHLIPAEGSTRVQLACGELRGPFLARRKAKGMLKQVRRDTQEKAEELRDIIVSELDSGAAVQPEAVAVPAGSIEQAVRTSLAAAD